MSTTTQHIRRQPPRRRSRCLPDTPTHAQLDLFVHAPIASSVPATPPTVPATPTTPITTCTTTQPKPRKTHPHFDHNAFFTALSYSDHTQAIEMLYALATRTIKHLAYRSTHHDDIVQNAVLRMYRSASTGKLTQQRNPHAYLTRICQNEIHRLNGKNKKHWQAEVDISDYI